MDGERDLDQQRRWLALARQISEIETQMASVAQRSLKAHDAMRKARSKIDAKGQNFGGRPRAEIDIETAQEELDASEAEVKSLVEQRAALLRQISALKSGEGHDVSS